MLTSRYFLYNLSLEGGDPTMPFTYKPLWKMLIDKDMTKKELSKRTDISKSTIDKMGRGEMISLEIIDRICNHFSCRIEDVVEYYGSRKEKS